MGTQLAAAHQPQVPACCLDLPLNCHVPGRCRQRCLEVCHGIVCLAQQPACSASSEQCFPVARVNGQGFRAGGGRGAQVGLGRRRQVAGGNVDERWQARGLRPLQVEPFQLHEEVLV